MSERVTENEPRWLDWRTGWLTGGWLTGWLTPSSSLPFLSCTLLCAPPLYTPPSPRLRVSMIELRVDRRGASSLLVLSRRLGPDYSPPPMQLRYVTLHIIHWRYLEYLKKLIYQLHCDYSRNKMRSATDGCSWLFLLLIFAQYCNKQVIWSSHQVAKFSLMDLAIANKRCYQPFCPRSVLSTTIRLCVFFSIDFRWKMRTSAMSYCFPLLSMSIQSRRPVFLFPSYYEHLLLE